MATLRAVDIAIQLHPNALQSREQKKILDFLTRQKIIFKKETLRQRFQTTDSKLNESGVRQNLLRILQRDFAIFYARGQQWVTQLERDNSQARKAQKELQDTWKDCLASARTQLKSWADVEEEEASDSTIEIKDPKLVKKTLQNLTNLDKQLAFVKTIAKLQKEVFDKAQSIRQRADEPDDPTVASAVDKLSATAHRALEGLFHKNKSVMNTLETAQDFFDKKIDAADAAQSKVLTHASKIISRGAKELAEDLAEAQEGIDDFIALLEEGGTKPAGPAALAAVQPELDQRTISGVIKAAKILNKITN